MNTDLNSLDDFSLLQNSTNIYYHDTLIKEATSFFSLGLPEIARLMLIYERGLETRTRTSPLDTVRIKNHKTQEQLKRVASISVQHKTSHKLPTATSWLIHSLVRVLNVCSVGVSCWIIVRPCNYCHSMDVTLKCYLASDWNYHWDHLWR